MAYEPKLLDISISGNGHTQTKTAAQAVDGGITFTRVPVGAYDVLPVIPADYYIVASDPVSMITDSGPTTNLIDQTGAHGVDVREGLTSAVSIVVRRKKDIMFTVAHDNAGLLIAASLPTANLTGATIALYLDVINNENLMADKQTIAPGKAGTLVTTVLTIAPGATTSARATLNIDLSNSLGTSMHDLVFRPKTDGFKYAARLSTGEYGMPAQAGTVFMGTYGEVVQNIFTNIGYATY